MLLVNKLIHRNKTLFIILALKWYVLNGRCIDAFQSLLSAVWHLSMVFCSPV